MILLFETLLFFFEKKITQLFEIESKNTFPDAMCSEALIGHKIFEHAKTAKLTARAFFPEFVSINFTQRRNCASQHLRQQNTNEQID